MQILIMPTCIHMHRFSIKGKRQTNKLDLFTAVNSWNINMHGSRVYFVLILLNNMTTVLPPGMLSHGETGAG